ncbi:MAG: hypothetical protein GF334_02210 [Candidatus Altiarchaeales archaeon]|nr:hypothetical protein [Candidatus Altiarchaeales archaeon]
MGAPKPLVEFKLKWFDHSSLYTENQSEILSLALLSLGINAEPAREVFWVLLAGHKKGLSLSVKQIRDLIYEKRKKNGETDLESGLTVRNIQVWLSYFQQIGLVECLGDKYIFRGGKKPSQAFEQYTKPLIEKNTQYIIETFVRLEELYEIR